MATLTTSPVQITLPGGIPGSTNVAGITDAGNGNGQPSEGQEPSTKKDLITPGLTLLALAAFGLALYLMFAGKRNGNGGLPGLADCGPAVCPKG